MLTGSTVMDKPLWVPMDADERKGHVSSLLRHLARIDELEAKKKAANKKFTSDIEQEMQEVQRLRRVLSDDGQQMTLADATVDQVPGDGSRITEPQAATALAHVADAQDTAAVEFEGEPPTTCWKCGKESREYMAGRLCTDTECDWIARPKGMRIDGTPIDAPSEATPAAEHDACVSCGKELHGIERVKELCETCQTSRGGDPLAGTPEEARTDEAISEPNDQGPQNRPESPREAYTQPGAISSPQFERAHAHAHSLNADEETDDPRPRCHIAHCRAVLDADEVEREHGVCAKHDPEVEKPQQQEGDEQPAPPAA